MIKVKEGIDYQLIPADHHNEQAWEIRVLEGPFVETVLRFGNISFNPEDDCLNFNFVVSYSPSDITEEDANLQQYAGAVLEDIIERSIQDGTVEFRERESD
jgi:hypothetical protein